MPLKKKRATSNEQERSPKSSVEMTVVNIDDRPAAKKQRKKDGGRADVTSASASNAAE